MRMREELAVTAAIVQSVIHVLLQEQDLSTIGNDYKERSKSKRKGGHVAYEAKSKIKWKHVQDQ